jgi:hypothetical protein
VPLAGDCDLRLGGGCERRGRTLTCLAALGRLSRETCTLTRAKGAASPVNITGEAGKKSRGTLHPNSGEVRSGRGIRARLGSGVPPLRRLRSG